MNIYAPDYFPEFNCIGEKCRHNCCIGWEIDIDSDTLEYYRSIQGDFGARLRNSVITENGTSFFKLSHDERCPFLNQNNLCDIILNLGEDSLCQICTDHPRFRNYFDSYTEIGLGITCEEAARLILTRTKKTEIINILDGKILSAPKNNDLFLLRNHIFEILQDRDLSLKSRIEKLIDTYKIKIPHKSITEWAEFYLTLEQLDPDWHERIETLKTTPLSENSIFNTPRWQIAFEQLIVYFIYRHLADFIYDNSFNERIAFCLLSYQIIHSLCMAHIKLYGGISIDTLIDISRQYSSEIEYSEENINCISDELKAP